MASPNPHMSRSTIYALSSGQPPAGIAVVRISGVDAGAALKALTERDLPAPRRAVTHTLINPVSRETLDNALVLWLPAPNTVTGEDMAELHLHGGRAVVAAVLSALAGLEGLVAAEAGAFTRRAFDNGQIDLAQVEGLADLLSAETESQRRSALALSEGALGRLAEGWRRSVLHCAAQIEALLDFADEADVTHDFDAAQLRALSDDVSIWLNAPSAERLRDGVRLVLAGPPNAGKSTLLNALAARDAAITSPIAGTTRDIVEVPVVIKGIPFVLTDTAGLHDASEDAIEQEGIKRAHAALNSADIILWLGAVEDCPDVGRSILIQARADEGRQGNVDGQLRLSVHTGEGMLALHQEIARRAKALLPAPNSFAINQRQRDIIARFADEVRGALASQDALLVAEHLRLACHALDDLIGKTGVEEMLDALFGGFCIGK